MTPVVNIALGVSGSPGSREGVHNLLENLHRLVIITIQPVRMCQKIQRLIIRFVNLHGLSQSRNGLLIIFPIERLLTLRFQRPLHGGLDIGINIIVNFPGVYAQKIRVDILHHIGSRCILSILVGIIRLDKILIAGHLFLRLGNLILRRGNRFF